MKKNTLIIGFFAAFALSSCYEDKSTLPENPIDGVELIVTEEEKVIRIGYKEQLDIVPNITKNGKADDNDLTYEWAINIYPGWSKSEFEVVGTEKELHTVLNNEISNDSYYLRLLVTDTKHDNLQYSFLYQVYVQPSMLDGLLIADTKDGQTTDFNLVMNKKLTASYDKEEKIFRNILAGKEYSGLIKRMSPITSGNYSSALKVNMMAVVDEAGKAGQVVWRFGSGSCHHAEDGTGDPAPCGWRNASPAGRTSAVCRSIFPYGCHRYEQRYDPGKDVNFRNRENAG